MKTKNLVKLFLLCFVTDIIPFPAYPQTSLHKFRLKSEYRFLNSSGEIEKRSSDFDADSGSIFLPENRRATQSRSIRIPFVRIRSRGDSSSSPVFWFSGGPGQTNLKSFQYDYFIGHHDHVMVGYRGVDGSVSLDCPEVTRVLEDGGDILDSLILHKTSAAFRMCSERLVMSGVDLTGYTPLDVADDMDAVRSALGYESIDIISESYGTRVAYLYALKYPARVHRMIMIGANPPGRMVWNAAQYDSMLVRYSDIWKEDPMMSGRCSDLAASIRIVNSNMPKRWLFFPIHEGTVKASMNALLFHRGTAAQAFEVYCAAANGDASGLWLVSFVGSRIFPSFVNWGDNASKAASADFDSTVNYVEALLPPGAIMGSPLGAFLWAPAQYGSWPVSLMPEEFRRARRCDVPTLFLSGSLDFSTPAANVASDFLPKFPKGKSVVLSEAGHILDLWQSQPKATHLLLTTFLETGAVDISLVKYVPMSFKVSWGFPFLAKISVLGVCVVAALLTWIAWSVFRRIRKKRSLARAS